MKQDQIDRLRYAFGHLVSGYIDGDPHAGDSMDLGLDTLIELGLSADQIEIVVVLAEHVNYEYQLRPSQ